MIEAFGQLYMYFLILMGVAIGIGFALVGYGFKGFLGGAFFTIGLGMISFTFAAILLVIFVNVALKSISGKANKFLIPLIVLGLVIDIFRYTGNTEDNKPNRDDKNDYELVEKNQVEEDNTVSSNEENEVGSNTEPNEVIDPVKDTSLETKIIETQTTKADLDTVPVPGAINTVESARYQISYLIYSYLDAYTSGDIPSLEYYVHPSTPFYSEQLNYMNSLNAQGVVVELIDYTINSIEQIAVNKYQITVDEFYTIDKPQKGLSDATQTSLYTIELIDGEFYITALEI
ncbi:hypothetical protein [Lysinibacillus sp. G4S2]|uniref:TcaA NTF2-like domain-containing protein n=1 Tax=Lysinibacillus sp. G4S2 TaxID=3055859 RepID=UPI0025A29D51|nr:hypothetical protein [Lysinibacillus sp. G4S2]MDM5251006.1 hypothetical protein [Lysinibacillus sp. G4S2]